MNINNNRIDNSGDDGIEINEETFFCECHGNHITNAGSGKSYGAPNGIEVQDGSHHIAVHANTIQGSKAAGIEISSHTGKPPCYQVTISANQITNGTEGIFINGLAAAIQYDISIIGNTILNTNVAASWVIFSSYADRVTIIGNTIRSATNAAQFKNITKNLILSNNIFTSTSTPATSITGIWFLNTIDDVRVSENIITGFGRCGIEVKNTVNNMHISNNHITDVLHYNGACVRWTTTTSSRCRVDNNYLRGSHWSYDGNTATYDILAAGWTEAWNEKHIV